VSAQSGDTGVTLERAIRKETVEGDLKGAIDLYKKVIAGAAKNRAAAAKALLRLGECYEKQGDAEAKRTYERLVREFSDQTEEAREARTRLAAGGSKSMVAQLIAKGGGGRVTPDGKLCPIIDQETGDVAVRDLQTGAIRHLTNEGGRQKGGGRGSSPIASRDGKQIAYKWQPGSGPQELRVINVDGSGMRTVPYPIRGRDPFFEVGYIESWVWSPDGKSILAAGDVEKLYGLSTIDLGSGEARGLADKRASGGRSLDLGGYSPDGHWVIYSVRAGWDSPDWDIFAIDTQTGKETAVVTGAGADRKPMWAPDGDKIVFRSDRNGNNAIWMVRFRDGQAAGTPILVKPDAGDYEPQGITSDGSFFYSLSHESRDVYQATVDPRTLRVQGTPARLVETYLGRNWGPSWSPSGDSFAYFSERDKVFRLLVHRVSSKETVAADPIRWPVVPHWCGSGEGLISWGTPTAVRHRIFDARTGEASAPDIGVKGLRAPFQLGLSPDCKAVYVSSYLRETKQRRIYRYDISTARETDLLTDAGDWATGPSVSPDGRWLALHGKLEGGKESGILVLSTAGGPLRMLAPASWGKQWTPDSKHLMYSHNDELYWVSVEGGAPQSMGIRMPGVRFPSLNADGRRLLFEATESFAEFWVLRNLPLN
jgi:Tol biopolymer transport system component